MKANTTNFTAIDIGSSKISILAADIDKLGNARIGYQSLYKSSGIKGGLIKDFQQAENSIISSIYNLEMEMQVNITSVSIAISGVGTKSVFLYKKVKLLDGKVKHNDLKTLHDIMIQEVNHDETTVIHYFPIEYTLDQNQSITNPVGMYGTVLGCKMHLVTANSSQVTNILHFFSKCNIEVKEILLGSYAAGLAVLTDDEKMLGSVVIDLGAETTSFAVFSGGKLIYTKFVPLGGDKITSDIAKVLSISMNNAEKLKVMYGSAVVINKDSESLINLAEFSSGASIDEEHNITSNELSMIINVRVEEIIDIVKSEYDKAAVDHLVARRIVLTGGGSQLRGVKDVVSTIFSKQVRIGAPVNIPGFEDDHTSQSYCASIGIIKNEIISAETKPSIAKVSKNLFQKLTVWFKK
ncbi:MAG: cell division protein FtsA [Rickettsiaceae bacterium]|nr:cell division protein FtsA [Rickettsiaceae bacterium]